MSRALLVLDAADVREKAKRWIDQAPVGTRVEYKAPKRSLEQNAMMWACLTEVADQVTHHGLKLTTDDWKLIFIDALKRENRIAPNLDGTGFVSLGRSTSDLSKEEMTDLIELILAFGAKHGVTFKDNDAANQNTNTDDAALPLAASEEDRADMSPPPASASSILSRTDRTDLIECAKKMFAITADDELTPEARRGVLVTAKDEWKAYLPVELHEHLRSIFISADAVIKGSANREDAISEFANVLECEPAEIWA